MLGLGGKGLGCFCFPYPWSLSLRRGSVGCPPHAHPAEVPTDLGRGLGGRWQLTPELLQRSWLSLSTENLKQR